MSNIKTYIKNNLFNLSKKIDKLKDEEIIFEIQNNLLKDNNDKVIINSNILETQKIFNIKNSSDIISEKPEFLIPNILPIQKNEINIISSKGGVGKSILALYLLLKIKEEHNLKVFGYFSEDSLGITKNRIDLINKSQYQNINIDIIGRETRPNSFLSYNEMGNFIPSPFFQQFKLTMKKYNIIVIDPLLPFLITNENSNIEARAFMNLFNEWTAEEDKTFIFLHHHNKEDNLRGATDFVNAARIHYKIEKQKKGTLLCKLEKQNNLPTNTNRIIDIFNTISHNGISNNTLFSQKKGKILVNQEEFDNLASPSDFDNNEENTEFFIKNKENDDKF